MLLIIKEPILPPIVSAFQRNKKAEAIKKQDYMANIYHQKIQHYNIQKCCFIIAVMCSGLTHFEI